MAPAVRADISCMNLSQSPTTEAQSSLLLQGSLFLLTQRNPWHSVRHQGLGSAAVRTWFLRHCLSCSLPLLLLSAADTSQQLLKSWPSLPSARSCFLLDHGSWLQRPLVSYLTPHLRSGCPWERVYVGWGPHSMGGPRAQIRKQNHKF